MCNVAIFSLFKDDEIDVVNTDGPAPLLPSIAQKDQKNVSSKNSKSATAMSSSDVKKQLHNHLQKGMQNRQKDSKAASSSKGKNQNSAAKNTTVKASVKRLGKPDAYTKRMMNYHSEVSLNSKYLYCSFHIIL